VAIALAVGYALAAWAYWPAMRPATGVQQPLHFNESYVWPRPWTLKQAAPGVPGPTPVALLGGADSVTQGFTACADRLAMVRVWLAAARDTTSVRVSLIGSRDPADELHAATFEVAPGGRYYAMTFPPLVDSRGKRFYVRLSSDAPAAVRVGYVDALGGLLYINEYSAVGDLDFGTYYRGPPGAWTLRVLGERLLPGLLVKRLGQYKPGWAKGWTAPVLAALLAMGCVVLLGASWPACRAPRLLGTAGVLLLTLLLFGGRDLAAMYGIGERRVASHPGRAAEVSRAETPRVTHSLLAQLEWASRHPEPRLMEVRWIELADQARPAVVAPGESRIGYHLSLSPDSELRFFYACLEGEGTLAVEVEGQRAWESQSGSETWQSATLDLRPWGAHVASLKLVSEGEGRVVWGDPQVVSERSWLMEQPPAGYPQQPLVTRFGDEIELLGYDLEASDARPGGELRATFYWRALRPMEVGYTVFLHLRDETGERRGQRDSQPLNGTYPTSAWLPGAVVRDEYVVPIAGDAPLGAYRVALGLYDLATMQRLPAYDAAGEPWPDRQVLLELGGQ
jgi:hypothetical protein